MLTVYHTKCDFEQSDCQVAVLPVGATEQHGSHLPVGTDTIFAKDFASRIAEKLNAYLLPAIAISSSIEHRNGKGTVYLKGETLALVLRDIAESLQYSGFRKLIIVNTHGGNWIIKPAVRKMNRDLNPMQVVLLQGDIPIDKRQEIFQHAHNDVHAGEMETSLMLHLHPEYVREIKKQVNPEFFHVSFMDYFDVSDITDDGYWGFPEEAAADKGSKFIEFLLEYSLQYLDEVDKVTNMVLDMRANKRENERGS